MEKLFTSIGYGNYALFIVFSFIIVVSSYTISHIVHALDKRTKFSGVLISATIVAFVSSIPECTSSLFSIFYTNDPASASGNLLGGNLFRTAMLAFSLLFFVVLMKKAKTTLNQVCLVVSEIVIFVVFFLVMFLGKDWKAPVSTGIFTSVSVFVILIYIFNLVVLIKTEKREEAQHVNTELKTVKKPKGLAISYHFENFFNRVAIKKIVILFVLASLLIVFAAAGIAGSTDWILDKWRWKEAPGSSGSNVGFGYSLLLGIVTTIPEIITVVTLLKLGHVTAAIADVLGSNIVSCVILSFVDLIYWKASVHQVGTEEAVIISFWSILIMVFFGGVLWINHIFTKRKLTITYRVLIISGLVLSVLCYLIYILLSCPGISINYLRPI